jgi:hypothetical protein
MQSEIINVMINALVEHDIARVKQAVMDGDHKGLDFLREKLECGTEGYAHYDTCQLIDEFQERGLELVARERPNIRA